MRSHIYLAKIISSHVKKKKNVCCLYSPAVASRNDLVDDLVTATGALHARYTVIRGTVKTQTLVAS